MIGADPGRVLRRAVLLWGLGHMALGLRTTGTILLLGELASLLILAWLTVGLADTNLYLVPFLVGVAFIVGWTAQAVHAYRVAIGARHAVGPPADAAAAPSPALAIGWLSLPLLVWGAGFWLFGASAAAPAAVLDRFVTQWHAGSLEDGRWPPEVVELARAASDDLGTDAARLRDVRVRVVEQEGAAASAVAEAIHFERRDARFLWVFPGSELVPVADRTVLTLELVAEPSELPGGGDVGAVRWALASADRP